jgi:hypothetical protein
LGGFFVFGKLKRILTKTIMKRFDELRDLIMSLEADFDKFYSKGNAAAGTRVRKGMQELKNLAQEIRVEVQNVKNKNGGGWG